MAKDANLYIRVDQNIKKEAEQLFANFGITVTDAVNMFLHKAIMVGGLPFDLKINTPNTETKSAIQEIEDMKNGKIPKNSMSVTDFIKEMGE